MDDQPSNRGLKSKDIIPVLMLVGYVLVNLYGKWPRWSWILLIRAVLSFSFDHHASLKNVVLKWKESRDDKKAARKAFPELQEFVRRFASFVNKPPTLHRRERYLAWSARTSRRLPTAECRYVGLPTAVFLR